MKRQLVASPDEGRPLQHSFALVPPAPKPLPERYERFLCPECHVTHKIERNAVACCAPIIEAVFECPTCEETYKTVELAVECEDSHKARSADPLGESICPLCFSQQDDLHAAVHHCLWKRIGLAEREQLIRDVQLGRHEPTAYLSH